jgi:hypothetical protein
VSNKQEVVKMINTMKVFYNGVKINGEKTLIKMDVYEADDSIRILDSWRWSNDLREALKEICEYNFSAPQFWGDHGETTWIINKENPLYPVFKHMALARKKHDYKIANRDTSVIEFEMKNYSNIADENVVKFAKEYIENCKAEITRKIEEEKQAEIARMNAEIEENKKMIREISDRYPIEDSKTYVVISWSENAALRGWSEGGLKLSIKSADELLKTMNRNFSDIGYDKTDFEIFFDGEESYTGRFDIGSDSDGLIAHLQSFANYEFKVNNDEKLYNERLSFIEKLVNSCENQVEVSV